MSIRYYLNGSEWRREALPSDLDVEHLSWFVFTAAKEPVPQAPMLDYDVISVSSQSNNLMSAIHFAQERARQAAIGDVWVSAEGNVPAGGWPL